MEIPNCPCEAATVVATCELVEVPLLLAGMGTGMAEVAATELVNEPAAGAMTVTVNVRPANRQGKQDRPVHHATGKQSSIGGACKHNVRGQGIAYHYVRGCGWPDIGHANRVGQIGTRQDKGRA